MLCCWRGRRRVCVPAGACECGRAELLLAHTGGDSQHGSMPLSAKACAYCKNPAQVPAAVLSRKGTNPAEVRSLYDLRIRSSWVCRRQS